MIFNDLLNSLVCTQINTTVLLPLLLQYGMNLLFTFIIVFLIYKRNSKDANYIFTYCTFNTMIFFICYLMMRVELGIGFAFGLFALFSIMRYRTTTIQIKEMTYLFVVVCIAVMNALGMQDFGIAVLAIINVCVVSILFSLEKILFPERLEQQLVVYEKIELVKAAEKEALINDLKERTGLDIVSYEIERVNFLNDSADLLVSYRPA